MILHLSTVFQSNNIIWNQHQPFYKDPSTDRFELPWVYMHAIKDYHYMISIVPADVNVTFEYSGSLLNQLQEYNTTNVWDRRLELAKMNETDMSLENKTYVLRYFFDINPQFRKGPYAKLDEIRESYGSYEEAAKDMNDHQIRDIKAMFLINWINPYYIENNATLQAFWNIANLWPSYLLNASKYTGTSWGAFTNENITCIIDAGYDILRQIFPANQAALAQGNVELITTPMYHPIAPLLINLTLARETTPGNKNLALPTQNTLWPEDARTQIQLGVQMFNDIFSATQYGMWPSEGSVTPAMIPMCTEAGIEWMFTDQENLDKVFPNNDFNDENTTLEDMHLLYQPYRVTYGGEEMMIVYRDTAISDAVGFQYSGLRPEAAAADFVGRIKKIYDAFNESTNSTIHDFDRHMVTVALDGENAWEYYQFEGQFTGNEFLNQFYADIQAAQSAGWLKTVTPKQFLDKNDLSSLTTVPLTTGSWIAGDFNTWIGEEEENIAWDRLITARNTVKAYNDSPSGPASTEAWDAIYAAEGSDWFWWYGGDKNSGQDENFDWAFKSLLRAAYKGIGWTDQDILDTYPELFVKQRPSRSLAIEGFIEPTINGTLEVNEWTDAAYFNDTAREATDIIGEIYAGWSEIQDKLYLAITPAPGVDFATSLGTDDLFIGIYFSRPGENITNIYTRYGSQTLSARYLGFEIATEIGIWFSNFSVDGSGSFRVSWAAGLGDYTTNTSKTSIAIGDAIELEIAFETLKLEGGDIAVLNFVAASGDPLADKDIAPFDGPWATSVPMGSVGGDLVFKMEDPEGDDSVDNPKNPDGSLSPVIYPTDTIFSPGYGHFDLLEFQVLNSDDEEQVAFIVKFPNLIIDLSWNTPTFTLPYTQIYVDTDRVDESGSTDTIEEAWVDIESTHAWEFMINGEGEIPNQYVLFENGTEVYAGFTAFGDTVSKTVTMTMSYDIVGKATANWAYVVLIGSKDYAHFRHVNAVEAQWTLGGRNDGDKDPNVIDMLVPPGKDQEAILSSWTNDAYATVLAVGPGIAYEVDKVPPNVTITSPSLGATIDGKNQEEASVDVGWNIEDNEAIALVKIYANQYLVGESRLGDFPNASASSLAVGIPLNGQIKITVIAFDAAGNWASDDVTVTVTNVKEMQPAGLKTEEESDGIPGFLGMLVILSLSMIALISWRRRHKEVV
ncbi:MAG: glucodextranase DOMON-like domain-containing protein [Candidatus Thorarchaeota archaeon]